MSYSFSDSFPKDWRGHRVNCLGSESPSRHSQSTDCVHTMLRGISISNRQILEMTKRDPRAAQRPLDLSRVESTFSDACVKLCTRSRHWLAVRGKCPRCPVPVLLKRTWHAAPTKRSYPLHSSVHDRDPKHKEPFLCWQFGDRCPSVVCPHRHSYSFERHWPTTRQSTRRHETDFECS